MGKKVLKTSAGKLLKVGNKVLTKEVAAEVNYFYVEALAATDITFSALMELTNPPSIYYKVDSGSWAAYTFGNTISLTSGQKCYWKGDNDHFSGNPMFPGSGSPIGLTATGNINVGGNINTLYDSTGVSTALPAVGMFAWVFRGCTTLISAANLLLPAMTLTDACYDNMFNGCTNLTSAPATLPALAVSMGSYLEMFENCSSLTTPPALPATTLAQECYNMMFYGCSGLTSVPAFPATTLAQLCYIQMFIGCTSLWVSSTQTAEAPYAWRIPKTGTFTNTATCDQAGMFTGCLGTRTYDGVTGVPGEYGIFYTQNPPVE